MNTNLGPPTGWSPPPDDQRRLQALRRYRILDSLPDQAFEDVVQLATTICGTPQAVVTFVDEERQWFKASRGIKGEETERGIAFCDIAIRRPDEVTIVRDASQHPVFRHYPQVTGEDHLRFYAGAPMVTPDGFAGVNSRPSVCWPNANWPRANCRTTSAASRRAIPPWPKKPGAIH